MTRPLIDLELDSDSQVFVATRPIRNSDHANGTIAEGARVFFRADEEGLTLAYERDGRPTNGNQYVTFGTVAAAREFAERAGLTPADA